MNIKTWRAYCDTHNIISKINSIIMNGEDDYFKLLSSADRREYFELRYTIGDFDRLPIFDKFKPEYAGVSITGKRELPKAYLRGFLNIFKLSSFCANHDLVFDRDGLPF